MPAGVTFTSITQGNGYRCALTPLGIAYCWGNRTSGVIGDGVGAGMPVLMPQQVTMPSGVTFTSIDAHRGHTCAISTSNTAYCWGDNDSGQLGDGTSIDRSVPVPVTLPSGITFTKIAAGDNHTCALSSTGTAYCWGSNHEAQFGDGTTTDSLTPVAVPMPSGGVVFRDISAGQSRTCALSTTNVAYCWGPRYTTGATAPEAVTMPSGTTFTTITSGENVECALTPAGTAFCWGDTFGDGTVGDGTSTLRPNPVAVVMPAGVTFTTIHSAGNAVCATSSHGKVYCWGRNDMNQLGNGTSTNSNIPVMATHP